MTLRQAAEHTGLSATTLRRYIKSGRLRARLIPGRYGPEYVVTEEDLSVARLEAAELESGQEILPTRQQGAALHPAPAPQDAVPGMIYRELLMKHEQLLVQYGMLRVGGSQLYEARQELERRAREIEQANADLAKGRDRHAREIGELKSRVRQSELALAQKDEEIRAAKSQIQRLEIALRNAATARDIDSRYERAVVLGPAPIGFGAASAADDSGADLPAVAHIPSDH